MLKVLLGIVVLTGVIPLGHPQKQPAALKFDGFQVGARTNQKAQYDKWIKSLDRPIVQKFKIGSDDYHVVVTNTGSGLYVFKFSVIKVRATGNSSSSYTCVSKLARSTSRPMMARLSNDKKSIEIVEVHAKGSVLYLRYPARALVKT